MEQENKERNVPGAHRPQGQVSYHGGKAGVPGVPKGPGRQVAPRGEPHPVHWTVTGQGGSRRWGEANGKTAEQEMTGTGDAVVAS